MKTHALVFTLLLPFLVGFGGRRDNGPSWTTTKEPVELSVIFESAPIIPEWYQISGLYSVTHGDPADYVTISRLSNYIETAIPRIADQLGVPAGRVVHLYVSPNNESFREIQPGNPPRWADATAYPLRSLIFVRHPRSRIGTDEPLTQVIDHEITHILLGQAFDGQKVPTWLQEGMAQYVAKQYTAETTASIAKGMLGNNLMDFRELTMGFPRDPIRARLAYAQSADLIAFMANEYGSESLKILSRNLAAGKAAPAAVRAATGQDIDTVDKAWRKRLSTSHLWITPLVDDMVWFSLGGLLLVIGAIKVKRRNKKRLEALELEDRLRDLYMYPSF